MGRQNSRESGNDCGAVGEVNCLFSENFLFPFAQVEVLLEPLRGSLAGYFVANLAYGNPTGNELTYPETLQVSSRAGSDEAYTTQEFRNFQTKFLGEFGGQVLLLEAHQRDISNSPYSVGLCLPLNLQFDISEGGEHENRFHFRDLSVRFDVGLIQIELK